MTISQDDLAEIRDAVRAKGIAPETICPVCAQGKWTLHTSGFVNVVSNDRPLEVALSGEGFPLVVLVCDHCGNTTFLNMYVLGLGEMVERLRKSESVPGSESVA